VAHERQILLAARADVERAAATDDPAEAERYLTAATKWLADHERLYREGSMKEEREALRVQVSAQRRGLRR
jgi:hypothetical protein